ncbi:MAG: hypothetical protein JSS09_04570 [Verrucomicrobia bacterium]|nr:hypothetical protein [Verrucomicrobiota bacterium]
MNFRVSLGGGVAPNDKLVQFRIVSIILEVSSEGVISRILKKSSEDEEARSRRSISIIGGVIGAKNGGGVGNGEGELPGLDGEGEKKLPNNLCMFIN